MARLARLTFSCSSTPNWRVTVCPGVPAGAAEAAPTRVADGAREAAAESEASWVAAAGLVVEAAVELRSGLGDTDAALEGGACALPVGVSAVVALPLAPPGCEVDAVGSADMLAAELDGDSTEVAWADGLTELANEELAAAEALVAAAACDALAAADEDTAAGEWEAVADAEAAAGEADAAADGDGDGDGEAASATGIKYVGPSEIVMATVPLWAHVRPRGNPNTSVTLKHCSGGAGATAKETFAAPTTRVE